MSTKTTTPTDIRYEYMHIDMTNIFPNLFAKIISFTLPYSIILYIPVSEVIKYDQSQKMELEGIAKKYDDHTLDRDIGDHHHF